MKAQLSPVRLFPVLVVVAASLQAAQQPSANLPPSTNGAQSGEPRVRLVRSVSGSKGSEQAGRFVIEDPRTVFYVPQDKEVVAYFEWEGPRGAHHFEGVWKNPQGKPTVFSDFSYDAKTDRFGAFWKLILSEDIQPGLWAIEAKVDGELAGTLTFQILAESHPVSAAPVRRLLTPAEIYQRTLAATAAIEKRNAKGERVGTGSGFFVAEGLILTAFQVIDGASSLRVSLPDGRQVDTDQVLAWNRWQDWALVRVNSGKTSKLEPAKPKSWAVGDRCFYLDSTAQGDRIIVDTNLTGQHSFPRAGERWNVSTPPGRQGIGSALLDEYGEVIGVLGGALIPGARSTESFRFGYASSVGSELRLLTGIKAVLINLVSLPPANATSVSLEELARRGLFVLPLARSQNILYGTMARQWLTKGSYPQPVDEKFEFSRGDGEAAVLLTWSPKEKIKGLLSLGLYDLDNRLLSESKPKKIDLQPGRGDFSAWKFPISSLSPGIYRLDVALDGAPIWRAFFQIRE